MKHDFEAYYVDSERAPSDLILKFHRNSPSHDRWTHFVDLIQGGLKDIVVMLHDDYQAQFKIASDCWWIEFPDWETRCAFELTWMNNYHADPDQFA